MKFLFVVFAILSFIGMIEEREKTLRKYMMISFISSTLVLMILSTFG